MKPICSFLIQSQISVSKLHFAEELGDVCKCCDICHENNTREEKDLTGHAKNVIESLSQLRALKLKLRLTDLAMIHMGQRPKLQPTKVSTQFHNMEREKITF